MNRIIRLMSDELVFDLDDVFANFSEVICPLMNKVGRQSSNHDYKTYAFFEYHGLTEDEFADIINDHKVFSLVKPCDGAVEGFNILREKGFNIHFCTAREKFLNAKMLTKTWLDYVVPDYKSLTVMGLKNSSKAHYYNQNEGKMSLLLDDSVSNILDAVENGKGILPVVMTRPWNIADERVLKLERQGLVLRVSSVLELANMIEFAQKEAA